MHREFVVESKTPETDTLKEMKEQRTEALNTRSSPDGEKVLKEERPVVKSGTVHTKAEVPALIRELKEEVTEQARFNSQETQRRLKPHGEALIESSDNHETARAKVTEAFQKTAERARKY